MQQALVNNSPYPHHNSTPITHQQQLPSTVPGEIIIITIKRNQLEPSKVTNEGQQPTNDDVQQQPTNDDVQQQPTAFIPFKVVEFECNQVGVIRITVEQQSTNEEQQQPAASVPVAEEGGGTVTNTGTKPQVYSALAHSLRLRYANANATPTSEVQRYKVTKIEQYKRDNPTIFAWEIRERLIAEGELNIF